jgi:hypothetical protein
VSADVIEADQLPTRVEIVQRGQEHPVVVDIGDPPVFVLRIDCLYPYVFRSQKDSNICFCICCRSVVLFGQSVSNIRRANTRRQRRVRRGDEGRSASARHAHVDALLLICVHGAPFSLTRRGAPAIDGLARIRQQVARQIPSLCSALQIWRAADLARAELIPFVNDIVFACW